MHSLLIGGLLEENVPLEKVRFYEPPQGPCKKYACLYDERRRKLYFGVYIQKTGGKQLEPSHLINEAEVVVETFSPEDLLREGLKHPDPVDPDRYLYFTKEEIKVITTEGLRLCKLV